MRVRHQGDGGPPIRVLRIIDRLNVGGPALHAVLVSAGLDPARFQTLLVHGDIEPSEGDMAYLMDRHEINVVHLPTLRRGPRPLRDLRALLALYRLMRRLQPDVVHTHKSKAGVLGRVAAVLARVPVRVHTYHGHVLSGYFHPLAARGLLLVERALARGTTRLLTISDRLRDDLARARGVAPEGRFRVVPLGLDLAPFRTAERHRGELRRELELPPDAALIGVVGRLVPIKDHATFLRGFALCRDALPGRPLHAVLCGDGEERVRLRALVAALGLQSSVSFLGWRRDLPRVYADLDLLALTSRSEGTPVAVIEALAAGVPVVATSVGGVPDVLRGGARGALIPPGDAAALATAMGSILRDPRRRAEAADPARRDEVIAEYGIERLCRDLGRLYEDELAARRPPKPRPKDNPNNGVVATAENWS